MIDPTSQIASIGGLDQSLVNKLKDTQAQALREIQSNPEFTIPVAEPGGLGRTGRSDTFDNLIGDLVKEVDAKTKASKAEANKVLLGESDNIHQSMIASQEAGLAFTLLVEVRNKLVQSYQELMRMPV